MPARILVIEDNPPNLELMTYLLKAYKYEPLVATTGEAGLETAMRERPDLVLCDIQLPGMDGIEVMRRLKAEPGLERLPIVAVTALAMVGDKERMLSAGFDGYIGKPIEPAAFVGQVEKFLRPAQPLSPTDGPSVKAKHAGARILVVDNTAANRNLLASILQPSGYQVAISSNVVAATDRARALAPHLIISDIHMPGASGYELLATVKADPELNRVPFLFSSATEWNGDEHQKAMAMGAQGFLQQPVEAQDLLDTVERLLDRSQATHGRHPDR